MNPSLCRFHRLLPPWRKPHKDKKTGGRLSDAPLCLFLWFYSRSGGARRLYLVELLQDVVCAFIEQFLGKLNAHRLGVFLRPFYGVLYEDLAVRARHQPLERQHIAFEGAVGCYRHLAATFEPFKKGPFRPDAAGCLRVVEEIDELVGFGVLDAGLYAEGALTDGRQAY